ncbi:MAG: hypothetical protein HC919_01470 [Oscillatoriales cyanobacterium SM2_2_1]|nr:hypothetical protein [Oscillatoriales cyanobacterium SM2_2_1]
MMNLAIAPTTLELTLTPWECLWACHWGATITIPLDTITGIATTQMGCPNFARCPPMGETHSGGDRRSPLGFNSR